MSRNRTPLRGYDNLRGLLLGPLRIIEHKKTRIVILYFNMSPAPLEEHFVIVLLQFGLFDSLAIVSNDWIKVTEKIRVSKAQVFHGILL